MIKEKNAVINVSTLPHIAAIPFLVKQLFTNLITNSLKFSRHDAPQVITISAIAAIADPHFKKDGMQYHQVIVSDTGIGFEPSYADSIFKIFTRLHHEKNFQGSGVGLALCKKIMQMHKGYITASGMPNEGAVFSMFFPVDGN